MRRFGKPITPRQRRVLYLLAEGCLNKEIAALTGISEGGVKKHLENLRARYGVARGGIDPRLGTHGCVSRRAILTAGGRRFNRPVTWT